MAAENAKIKIGFVNNTLCVYDGVNLPQCINNSFAEIDKLEKNSFETDFENVLYIGNLYDFLKKNKYDIEKKWGIDINNIITDFERGNLRHNDKATFAVTLNIASYINLQGEMFLWNNITFKNKVNIYFKILDEFKKLNELAMPNVSKMQSFMISKCEFQNDFSLELRNDDNYVTTIQLRENKFKSFSLRCDKIGSIFFDKSIFSGDCNINKYLQSTICGNASFKDCIFENNANFSNCKFQGDVYFNNSEFKESANFREAEFEKVVSFYGATFDKVPNFNQAIFNGSLNLVNTNLNFDFTDVKDKINEEYKYRTESEKSMCSYRSKCKVPNFSQAIFKCSLNLVSTQENVANDFRDSFRLFKNALIKDNNLLDASNFHKVELYCKEIELGYKKRNLKRNSKDNSKPSLKDELKYWIDKIKSKDWIDLWQLKFYRAISDHHTDLAKIIHNTILMIGCFAWLFCIAHNLDSVNSFLNDSPSYWLFYGFSLIMQLMTLIVIGLCMFILYFSTKPLRASTSVCMYFGFIGLIWINPKYIFGIANLFNSATQITTQITPIQNILMTIYSVVAFIFIFSLQKTARRNSIIPN